MKRGIQMKKTASLIVSISILFLSFGTVLAKTLPAIDSQYVFITNMDTNTTIYDEKADQKMFPASLTKMMTTLVALEHIEDVNERFAIPEEVFDGLEEEGASVAGFKPNEDVSIKDILYGIMLPSGADATGAIAYKIAGSEQDFVKLMNKKAKALGLQGTHFVNASGLHEDEHYSTAKDMAIILEEGLKNPLFVEIFEADTYQTTPNAIHPEGLVFKSTRTKYLQTLQLGKGAMLGSKTGYTLEGGLCLASTIELNGATYIIINANAGIDTWNAPHVKDAYVLSNYLEENYQLETLYKANEIAKKKEVTFGKTKVEAYTKKEVSILLEIEDSEYKSKWIWESLSAPIEKGEKVATLQISYKGKEMKFPMYAKESVEKDWWQWIVHYFMKYGVWVLLIVGGALYIRNKRRPNAPKKRNAMKKRSRKTPIKSTVKRAK